MSNPFEVPHLDGPSGKRAMAKLYRRVTEQLAGTSTTSLTIGAGPRALNVGPDKQFATGQEVRIADNGDPVGTWMQGTVTAYDATTGALAVTVTSVSGAGAHADWTVSLAGGVGPAGRAVELQATATHIQWRYVGDSAWIDLLPLSELEGTDGREVQLQATSTYVQWRYAGDMAWANLVALADLHGREVELQSGATHVQWRYAGDPAWTDLIALSALTGGPGKSAYQAWLDEGNVGTEEDFLASLQGDAGTRGWSQILANVPDGARVVQRIVDWVGGTGVKPPVGEYLSPGGPVSDIALATDVRGAGGAGSGDVSGPSGATAGRLAAYADNTGKVLSEGPAVSDFATAAQGGKADSAVQPGSLATVATSGAYADLSGRPSLGSAAARDAGVASGLATLDANAKIPAAQLPAIAITETFVVNSQAAQLALTAQIGDVAVRTDQARNYIHNGGTSGTIADWTLLLAPASETWATLAGKPAVIAAGPDAAAARDVIGALGEAPEDGDQYARKDGGWVKVAAAGTITPFSQTLLAAADADTWRTLLGVAPDPLVYSMAYLTDPTLTASALQSWLGVSANRANYQTLLATSSAVETLSDTVSFKNVMVGSALASGDWSASATAMAALVGTATRMDYLIGSKPYLDWMLASTPRWDVLMGNPAKAQVQTPIMTSASAPYGTVTQSSQLNASAAAGFQAFTANGGNAWGTTSAVTEHWVQWVWPDGTPQSIQEITINPGNRADFAYARVRVSENGSTWLAGGDYVVAVNNNTGLQTIKVAMPGKFLGIRLEAQRGGGLSVSMSCDAFRAKGFA